MSDKGAAGSGAGESTLGDAIQKFLGEAGSVAKDTYAQLQSYAKEVTPRLDDLNKQAAGLSPGDEDKRLLADGAKVFSEAGAIFFQLANRALAANAEAARTQ